MYVTGAFVWAMSEGHDEVRPNKMSKGKQKLDVTGQMCIKSISETDALKEEVC